MFTTNRATDTSCRPQKTVTFNSTVTHSDYGLLNGQLRDAAENRVALAFAKACQCVGTVASRLDRKVGAALRSGEGRKRSARYGHLAFLAMHCAPAIERGFLRTLPYWAGGGDVDRPEPDRPIAIHDLDRNSAF